MAVVVWPTGITADRHYSRPALHGLRGSSAGEIRMAWHWIGRNGRINGDDQISGNAGNAPASRYGPA